MQAFMLFLYDLTLDLFYSIDACLLKKKSFSSCSSSPNPSAPQMEHFPPKQNVNRIVFYFPHSFPQFFRDGVFVSYCPITKASTNYRQRKGGGPNFVWVEPPVGIRAPMLCPCPLIGTSPPPPPHSSRPHLLLLSSPSSSTVIGH